MRHGRIVIAPVRPTVLLVDDEADILVALTDLLDEEYRLLSTTSPREALDLLARETDVAVIVSDQRMPEMPGNVFLGHARALCSAETLLLTGYADIDAVVSAVNDGGIGGYAHKPWEADALRAMIAAAAERYRLRRALTFEQTLFATLANLSRDTVCVLDERGEAVRGDRTIARSEDAEADREALAADRPSDEEVQSRGADGLPRFRRIQRFPVVADGRRYLLKIESDQSDRRALEQRLQQSEKLQSLGTLAGGIAHDFNNLLTAVLGNLELAQARPTEDQRLARYIGNAQEAARRGASLTNRLLSFTRQGEVGSSRVDVNALVVGMEDLIVRTTGGMIGIATDLAADAWPVRIEREQLELALLNLAINARDAMPGGGTIRIATANVPGDGDDRGTLRDSLAITVTDQGSGMSEDVAARVFEPFFTTKERGRGTGLGLPMVHALATNAGGRVGLTTGVGKGTTITIWLPRDLSPAAEPLAKTTPASSRSLRLMLVEDDADVRAVSSAALRALGHRVKEAASGTEALAALAGTPGIEAVITDFVMPGMSGVELARQTIERWPMLPVIIATGFAETGELPPGVTTIRKPFSKDDLAKALAARLG